MLDIIKSLSIILYNAVLFQTSTTILRINKVSYSQSTDIMNFHKYYMRNQEALPSYINTLHPWKNFYAHTKRFGLFWILKYRDFAFLKFWLISQNPFIIRHEKMYMSTRFNVKEFIVAHIYSHKFIFRFVFNDNAVKESVFNALSDES